MKKTLAIFISIICFFSSSFVLAATSTITTSTESSSASRGQLVATVGINNTQIVLQNNRNLGLSFDITNRTGAQSQIKYAIKLTKGDLLVDEKVFDETISLGQNTTIHKTVNYSVPDALSTSTYKLWVESKNDSGLILSTVFIGDINILENVSNTIEIIPGSCYLTVNATKFLAGQGAFLDPTNKFTATCKVNSNYSSDITVSPNFVTREKTNFGNIISASTTSVEKVAIKKGQSEITIELPKALKPDEYSLSFSLFDNTKLISNAILFNYVLAGDRGTVENVVFDKTSYKSGETANLQIFSMQTIGTSTLTIIVTNKSGESCTASLSKEISDNSVINLSLPINKSCVNPKAEVTISSNGKVLDSRYFNVITPTTSTLLQIIIVLAIIIIIVYLGYFLSKRKYNKNILKISLFIFVSISVFSIYKHVNGCGTILCQNNGGTCYTNSSGNYIQNTSCPTYTTNTVTACTYPGSPSGTTQTGGWSGTWGDSEYTSTITNWVFCPLISMRYPPSVIMEQPNKDQIPYNGSTTLVIAYSLPLFSTGSHTNPPNQTYGDPSSHCVFNSPAGTYTVPKQITHITDGVPQYYYSSNSGTIIADRIKGDKSVTYSLTCTNSEGSAWGAVTIAMDPIQHSYISAPPYAAWNGDSIDMTYGSKSGDLCSIKRSDTGSIFTSSPIPHYAYSFTNPNWPALSHPFQMAIDSGADLYVLNGSNVNVFSANGAPYDGTYKYSNSWSPYGNVGLNWQSQINIDNGDQVFLTNGDNLIEKYTTSGAWNQTAHLPYGPYYSEYWHYYPYGYITGLSNYFYPYIYNGETNYVEYLTVGYGSQIKSFDEAARQYGPGYDYNYVYGGGDMVQNDSDIYGLNSKSSSDYATGWGSLYNNFTSQNSGDTMVAKGIALDSYGDVYVTDKSQNRVIKDSYDGYHMLQFGNMSMVGSNAPGKFNGPYGIAVNTNNNKNDVFVVDSNNNRIQLWQQDKTDNSGPLTQDTTFTNTCQGNFTPFNNGLWATSSATVYVSKPLTPNISVSATTSCISPTTKSVSWMASSVNSCTISSGAFSKTITTGGASNSFAFSPSIGVQIDDDMAVDKEGNIYVADRMYSNIQKYDKYGIFQWWIGYDYSTAKPCNGCGSAGPIVGGTWGKHTNTAGLDKYNVSDYSYWPTLWPGGINGVNGNETFLTMSYPNAMIPRQSNGNLNYNTNISQYITSTTTQGILPYPKAIAVNYATQDVYVLDQYDSRIQVYSKDGIFLKTIKLPTFASNQAYIYWDMAIDYAGKYIYLTDTNSNRVFKFDINGRFIWWLGLDDTATTINVPGGCFYNGGGWYNPSSFYYSETVGVSLTNGTIITKAFCSVTTLTETIQKAPSYWSDGSITNVHTDLTNQSKSKAGANDGEFMYPTDISVDFEGNIYVVDDGYSSSMDQYMASPGANRRIQKFSPDGKFLGKMDQKYNYQYGMRFTAPAFDYSGRGFFPAGTMVDIFDLRNDFNDYNLVGEFGYTEQPFSWNAAADWPANLYNLYDPNDPSTYQYLQYENYTAPGLGGGSYLHTYKYKTDFLVPISVTDYLNENNWFAPQKLAFDQSGNLYTINDNRVNGGHRKLEIKVLYKESIGATTTAFAITPTAPVTISCTGPKGNVSQIIPMCATNVQLSLANGATCGKADGSSYISVTLSKAGTCTITKNGNTLQTITSTGNISTGAMSADAVFAARCVWSDATIETANLTVPVCPAPTLPSGSFPTQGGHSLTSCTVTGAACDTDFPAKQLRMTIASGTLPTAPIIKTTTANQTPLDPNQCGGTVGHNYTFDLTGTILWDGNLRDVVVTAWGVDKTGAEDLNVKTWTLHGISCPVQAVVTGPATTTENFTCQVSTSTVYANKAITWTLPASTTVQITDVTWGGTDMATTTGTAMSMIKVYQTIGKKDIHATLRGTSGGAGYVANCSASTTVISNIQGGGEI